MIIVYKITTIVSLANIHYLTYIVVQLVAQLCLTICDPMDCITSDCPSPSPRACSNSCPSSRWCHPTSLSSVIPFSSCLQSFPGSVSFPVSWLFASGASASVSVLQMNIQGWSPLGWTGLISLQSRDSQESSPAPQFESITSLALSLVCCSTLTSIHDYWKNHSLD